MRTEATKEPQGSYARRIAAGWLPPEEAEALRVAFDENVERLKACEHIAEGDDGWEVLVNLCPSTAAVATLRRGREWRPIETAPKDHTLFLAATADGRMMIFRGDLLAHAMNARTPDHLTFPATHWMPLPPAPRPGDKEE